MVAIKPAINPSRKPSKKPISVAQKLSIASSALLGLSSMPLQAQEPWNIDLGLMSYSETDRNVGAEFLFHAGRELDDEDQVGFSIELDTLTGATPNGASSTNRSQTFTQSSGAGSYQSSAGELPVDDTHMDTRLAVGLDYLDKLSNQLSVGYNGRISMEFDYLSFGAGNNWIFDFNQNNTQFEIGVQGEYNRVHPVGNIPEPLALMVSAGSFQNRLSAAKSKEVAELGLGLTQVINRTTICQTRYTRSRFSGYLNDPYKIFSIIEDNNSAQLGATIDYRFENRPGTRNIDGLFLGCKLAFATNQLDVALRHSQDDWGIEANSIELRFDYQLKGGNVIQPRVRFYHQNEADFYRHSLPASETIPRYISADQRIGAFDAITIGVKYVIQTIDSTRHSLVFEYYQQDGEDHPADAIGLQQQQDLFPELEAVIFRYLFSTVW